jgi:hypothetical protein
MKKINLNSEIILNTVGNVLAVLSTIGIVVAFFKLIIFTERNLDDNYKWVREDANWLLFLAFLFSYLLIIGFAFMFKVLSNISKKR